MGRSVTVTGQGSAASPYDTATLSLAATARAANPSDATARASYAASRIREALLRGGVPEARLATTNVNLTPVYEPWPTVTGYEASLGLSARVEDLAGVGSLLMAAVDAGGDGARVDGVAFTHAESGQLARLARGAAFADARAKAEQYAGLSGQALGEVRHVVEGGPHAAGFRPETMKAMSADASGAVLPVDGGEGSVSASVVVTWALGPLDHSSVG